MLRIKETFRMKDMELLSYISIFFIVFYESIKESRLSVGASKIFLAFSFLAFANQIVRKVLLSEVKKKKLVSSIILVSIVFCILFQFTTNGDIRLVMSVFGIYSALWISESELINSVFYSKLIALVLVMITGGYRHINLFAVHSGMLLILYMCRHKKDFNKIRWLFVLLIYGAFCIITNSGSFIIGIGTALLLELLYLVFPKGSEKCFKSLFVKLFFPICFFANLLLVVCYRTYELPGVLNRLNMPIKQSIYKITVELNEFFTGRLALAQFSLEEFGYSLLGGNIDSYSNFTYKGHYFNLDSGMMWLLQGSGLLITGMFLVTMTIIMISFIDRKEYQYIIALMTISLWGINEDVVRSVGVNFMILFIGKAIVDIFERKDPCTKLKPFIRRLDIQVHNY